MRIEDIASSLCGKTTLNIFPIEGGRNSRIYRVENKGDVFALKFFRPDQDGKRERFEAETTALSLFAEGGIENTPRVIAQDKLNNCVLMEWIDGEPVDHYGVEEIEALVTFIQAVQDIVRRGCGREMRCATEACLNGSEIVGQINLRLSRLDDSKSQYPQLREFIAEEFIPAFHEISHWSQKQYQGLGLNFSENISFEQQTLSVVDFGFHNVLRKDYISYPEIAKSLSFPNALVGNPQQVHLGTGPDEAMTRPPIKNRPAGRQAFGGDNYRIASKFYFLDFEFFGWDDPVKLVADTLQHPGMALDDEKKQVLFSGLIKIFDQDEMFLTRLKLLYPLFGLKWCMIMLNPFLPGYQQLGTKGVLEKEKQLERVKNLTRSIHENYQEFPYDTEHSYAS